MNQTSRTSKLDPHRDEIVALRRQRKTYQDIVRHLAKEHGVRVAISTLSTYLDGATKGALPPAPAAPPGRPAPTVTPEQENFLAQAEVFAELQASTRMVVERMDDVIDAVRALNKEAQQRHEGMTSAFRSLKEEGAKAELVGLRETLAGQEATLRKVLERPNAPALSPASTSARVPAGTTRRIWLRALGLTAILWLFLIGLLAAFARPWLLTILSVK
jgi:hypothetical protein